MKVKILFISIVFLFSHIVSSQVNTQWVARYNGLSNNNDAATCMALDNAGNVYVGGYTVSAATDYDLIVIKYNSSGEQIWESKYNGPSNGADQAAAIAVDADGNVYVTGPSVSDTKSDFVTIKINPKGEQMWVSRYNGPGNDNDIPVALLVDKDGNVYVTGSSKGTESQVDFATIKYNSDGDKVWVARYNGPGNIVDYPTAMAMDGMGNIIVGGYSDYFETHEDFVVVKYSPNGTQLWMQTYNGPGNGLDKVKAIGVDSRDNIFVTGSSMGLGSNLDYATLKYDSQGELLWEARYNGPGNNIDEPSAISIDKNGFVFVTGSSIGINTNNDYATIKYNPDGVELWVARYNDQGNSSDQPSSIALDALGSVYVTGYVWNGTDNDYATIKYNSIGSELWVAKYNGPGNSLDKATNVLVDNSGNVYVTGYSVGNGTKYDITTVKYLQSAPEISPTLQSPAYGSSGISQTPTLEWEGIKNADYYKLQIASDKNFGSILIDTNIFISSDQYKVPAGLLNNNQQYYWRANAVNTVGSGSWSQTWNFSVLTPPDAPKLLSPQNNAAGESTTPTLSWQKSPTAETYRLQISKDFNFTQIIHEANNLSSNEFTLPGGLLSNNTQYFWRVNASNAGGTVPWSPVWSLGTGYVNPPAPPELLSLPNNSLGQSLTPTLTWNAIPSVSTYRIQIASDLNFTNVAVDEGNLTTTQYSVPAGKLHNNTMYYWKVIATNLGGTGQWSLIWTFSTMITGLQRVGNDIPKDLKLHENSPQPFSSTTSIRFDIPAKMNNKQVSIIVYDITGKEIARLLNEKIHSGSWIVNFDGSNYTRGYYLYQMHSESYVETKKMMLVK